MILYYQVGNSVAEWDDGDPFVWTLTVPIIKGGDFSEELCFDHRPLLTAFEPDFVYAFKEVWMDEVDRTSARSAHTACKAVQLALLRVFKESGEGQRRFCLIDTSFIILLNAVKDKIPNKYLGDVRRFYKNGAANNKLFRPELNYNQFPLRQSDGADRSMVSSILAKAMKKETLIHILSMAEEGFESGTVELGRYAALKLALCVFCRPESYRKILLKDLHVDVNPRTGHKSYIIFIFPAKTRIENPEKEPFKIPEDVGVTLALQREDVVRKYGHLVPMVKGERDVGILPLFPSVMLNAEKSGWAREGAENNLGMHKATSFVAYYLAFFTNLASTPFGSSRLRHTIGTSLASIGCSASTIQAVLRHADDTVARSYVDIAFEGLIDGLSDSLVDSFISHFPVFKIFASKSEEISDQRRIESEDVETGLLETTGACGRMVACQYAPLSCYGCHRFIPCYDADHSINLALVEKEIARSADGGLAMGHELERWRKLAARVVVVINLCKAHFEGLRSGDRK